MSTPFICKVRGFTFFTKTSSTPKFVAILQKSFVGIMICFFSFPSKAQTHPNQFIDLNSIKKKITVGAMAYSDSLSSLLHKGTCWVRFTVDANQRIKDVAVKDAPALLQQLIANIKGEAFKLPQGMGSGIQFLLPIYYDYGSPKNELKPILDKLPHVELLNDGSLKSTQKQNVDFNSFFGIDADADNIGVPVILLPWLQLSGKIQ